MFNIRLNKAALRAFIQRRRINALGLSVITAISTLITLLCAITGFARTNVLVVITVLLIALCLVYLLRNRKGFRTMRMRLRRKKVSPKEKL